MGYQVEDDVERISARLQRRVAQGEELGTRLEDVSKEISDGRELADRIIVNHADASQTVEAAVAALVDDFL